MRGLRPGRYRAAPSRKSAITDSRPAMARWHGAGCWPPWPFRSIEPNGMRGSFGQDPEKLNGEYSSSGLRCPDGSRNRRRAAGLGHGACWCGTCAQRLLVLLKLLALAESKSKQLIDNVAGI